MHPDTRPPLTMTFDNDYLEEALEALGYSPGAYGIDGL